MIKMELVIKGHRKCRIALADDWSRALMMPKGSQAFDVQKTEKYITVTCLPSRSAANCDTIEFVFDAKTKEPLNATYINFMGDPECDFKFKIKEWV